MKYIFILFLVCFSKCNDLDFEENEFAEFEDEDDWTTTPAPVKNEAENSHHKDEDDVKIEVEDEFDHFNDEEEFEGGDLPSPAADSHAEPKIKFANVPVYRAVNWDRFYMEMLMLAAVTVYFVNYVSGKARNKRLAGAWLTAHWPLLKANFSFVGDDGRADVGLVAEGGSGEFLRESENTYSLWCTGRVCCEGMLVQLKLLKRQDLVSVMATMFRGGSDQVDVRVTLSADEMDPIVFCVASRRAAAKLVRDMPDLAAYCPERRAADRYGLSGGYLLMAEVHESISLIVDQRVCTALNRFASSIEYIHISDQYTGPKQIDDNNSSSGDAAAAAAAAAGSTRCRPTISCRFNLSPPGGSSGAAATASATTAAASMNNMETMRALLQLTLYMTDRMKRCRLSKEARGKAERSRQRVQENALRKTHQWRSEQAQAKRDMKMRLQKERILQEEDPEKQRRMEEKNERREAKRRQPRMRQMRVKAL